MNVGQRILQDQRNLTNLITQQEGPKIGRAKRDQEQILGPIQEHLEPQRSTEIRTDPTALMTVMTSSQENQMRNLFQFLPIATRLQEYPGLVSTVPM